MPRNDVIFVCVENAGRSQMAEAFFRKYTRNLSVTSAGTKPDVEVNPVVIDVMKEVGIDLTTQKPKIISKQLIESSKIKVNMGCMDKKSCPSLFVEDLISWNISDPKGKSIDEVRKIRDEIELQVIQLVKYLKED